MQTQIAAAPFEQGSANRQAQGLDQFGQIATKQLVLQCLGGCRKQYPRSTQQRRNKIRESLANAGTGLDDKYATVVDGTCDRHGHVGLSIPGCELFDRARQQTAGREGFANKVLQTHVSGRFVRGQGALDSRDLVAQSESPFLQPAHQKLVQRAGIACTVYHGIKIAVLYTQLDQPTFGRMQIGVQESVGENTRIYRVELSHALTR